MKEPSPKLWKDREDTVNFLRAYLHDLPGESTSSIPFATNLTIFMQETATFVYGPIGSGKNLIVREVVDDFHRLVSEDPQ